ncbi:MAG: hypothetical protein LBB66_02700 [Desulfovibrio sp.]|nr:hypothetical protein [Desulfovibrio sp.]
MQSLKSKLSQLQAMLGQTTDEEAAGINAQISEVMSELAALQSQTA